MPCATIYKVQLSFWQKNAIQSASPALNLARTAAAWKIAAAVKLSVHPFTLDHLTAAFGAYYPWLGLLPLPEDFAHFFVAFLIHRAVSQRTVRALGTDVKISRHI